MIAFRIGKTSFAKGGWRVRNDEIKALPFKLCHNITIHKCTNLAAYVDKQMPADMRRDLSLETLCQGFGEVAQHRGIKLRSRLQIRAERVKHTGPRLGSFHHGRDDTGIELRL